MAMKKGKRDRKRGKAKAARKKSSRRPAAGKARRGTPQARSKRSPARKSAKPKSAKPKKQQKQPTTRGPERIKIWYGNGIEWDRDVASAHKKARIGVIWEADDDYEYEVLFDKPDGCPFNQNIFRNITKRTPRPSGPPDRGVVHYNYNYRIKCIQKGESADPTIKVDP